MRADNQTAFRITNLPDDCVGLIVHHLELDDKKFPILVSLSAWGRISKAMLSQLQPWMNPHEHACRLIDQVSVGKYSIIPTMNLVTRFAPFFNDGRLEQEIRISCGMTSNKTVNALLMLARAGDNMEPSAKQALMLHVKNQSILEGKNDGEYTRSQFLEGRNTVVEILAACGIQVFELKREKKKEPLFTTVLNDGLKAISKLSKPLRACGFLRIAKCLKVDYSELIVREFLAHSDAFIPTEWDPEFMESNPGAECLEALSLFMALPMPEIHEVEAAVLKLLRSFLDMRSAKDTHWTSLPDPIFDLSLCLYRSLQHKNNPDMLVQQLEDLGIFTHAELLIMDEAEWYKKMTKEEARTQFQYIMRAASSESVIQVDDDMR